MSKDDYKPEEENTNPSPPGPEAEPEARQNNGVPNGMSAEEYVAFLKRDLQKHLLTPELKAEILAEGPSDEEREQHYREMIEHGGLSGEELFEALGIPLREEP